jgi:hypothetical protein
MKPKSLKNGKIRKDEFVKIVEREGLKKEWIDEAWELISHSELSCEEFEQHAPLFISLYSGAKKYKFIRKSEHRSLARC